MTVQIPAGKPIQSGVQEMKDVISGFFGPGDGDKPVDSKTVTTLIQLARQDRRVDADEWSLVHNALYAWLANGGESPRIGEQDAGRLNRLLQRGLGSPATFARRPPEDQVTLLKYARSTAYQGDTTPLPPHARDWFNLVRSDIVAGTPAAAWAASLSPLLTTAEIQGAAAAQFNRDNKKMVDGPVAPLASADIAFAPVQAGIQAVEHEGKVYGHIAILSVEVQTPDAVKALPGFEDTDSIGSVVCEQLYSATGTPLGDPSVRVSMTDFQYGLWE